MKRGALAAGTVLAAGALLAATSALAQPTGPARDPAALWHGMVRRAQWVMGTRLTIAVEAGADDRAAEEILRAAFDEVSALDALFSHYRGDSALSELNARAGQAPSPVDPRLLALLRASAAFSVATDGAFDLSVGALLLAHRGAANARSLAAAHAVTGWRLIRLTRGGRVALARAGMRLDPGGIGKGWALDRVVALLRRGGVRRAFLDFGGSSFYALGAPEGARGWPLLVQGVDAEQPIGWVALRDEALSFSHARAPGDDGSPGPPHIVDPRSGRLIEAVRMAVAIAPGATTAEVLSTALVVEPRLRGALHARFRALSLGLQRAGAPPQLDRALRQRLRPWEGPLAARAGPRNRGVSTDRVAGL